MSLFQSTGTTYGSTTSVLVPYMHSRLIYLYEDENAHVLVHACGLWHILAHDDKTVSYTCAYVRTIFKVRLRPNKQRAARASYLQLLRHRHRRTGMGVQHISYLVHPSVNRHSSTPRDAVSLLMPRAAMGHNALGFQNM